MVGHCQSGNVAWMGPFPHARAMSQVMLYSAARSALGGVKVALYQQSKSMSKPHSSRITHLLEIREQTGKVSWICCCAQQVDVDDIRHTDQCGGDDFPDDRYLDGLIGKMHTSVNVRVVVFLEHSASFYSTGFPSLGIYDVLHLMQAHVKPSDG